MKTSSGPRVLVVGATGFVGRNVLEQLEARGEGHVIAACRDPSRLPSRFRAEARVGDLRDEKYLERLFADVDVVCLTAAWSALYGHARLSEQLFRVPLTRAIEAAVGAGVRRVVLTSALAVKHIPESHSRALRESVASVWPHLDNLVALETKMQELASSQTSMVAVRLATFTGAQQDLGILPVLVPRLRQRLVPWIEGGRAPLPMIDGADVGRAFCAAVFGPEDAPFQTLEATGPKVPTFFELVSYLHEAFDVPLPLFSVSYAAAFRFGFFAESFARWTKTQPLLTRSIVFLSEAHREDRSSWERWGYRPDVHWKTSVHRQVIDLEQRGVAPRLVAATPK